LLILKIGENNDHYPLEIQISAKSKDNRLAKISILFNTGLRNTFLSNIGFGEGIL